MSKDISRRTFLKLAGGSALALATLEGFGCDIWKSKAGLNQEVKIIPTQCQGCGANRCAVFAYVRNGRVWKIEGNPEANNNLGTVCPRGHGYLHELYDPDRIKQPLKRTEDGTYVPVSWEQAFTEINTQLNLIMMDSGPQSVFWLQYPMANAALGFRFMHALGSPNTFSHGSTCFTARNAAFNATYGGLPGVDLKNSRYTIIVGRNPSGGIKLQQMKDLMYSRDHGAKIVVVDPRHSETAIIADDWLPIKPGTDLALILAMLNVIIEEGLYDADFVKRYTVGFDRLQDEIITYPPEWAEKVCDIPKDTIVRIARELAANKPTSLVHRGYHGGYGASYLNSFQTARAIAIINAVIGNYERKGGLYMPLKPELGELKEGGHPSPDLPNIPKADGSGIPGRYPAGSYSDGITHAIPELAMSGELKAGIVYHSNPLRTNPNPQRVIAGYKKLQLLVAIDCVMSETASMAHYILPESFYLERDDCVDMVHSAKIGQLSMVQQVVKPLHDTKPLLEIVTGIAQGVGIGRYFAFSQDDLNGYRLKPFGITLEELKQKGLINVGEPWKEGFKKPSTPSGKLEIYSEKLDKWGVDPLPRWKEPLVSPDPVDPHSFRLLHGKQSLQTNSMTAHIPVLMEASKRTDSIRLLMNRRRAAALNIKDGDIVELRSQTGSGKIKVRLTDGLHPSAVWLPSGYGIFSRYLSGVYGVGISYNDFCPTYFDPVVGHCMSSEIIVRVEKA
jgi:thiosulfate reductase/polysulfide reductase chain A